jgi:methyl-accepting chemotaxis protein
MKLKFRLSIIVIAMMITVVSAISIILLTRASSMQIASAEDDLQNITGLNAYDVKARYEVYLDAAKTLAQIVNGYESVETSARRSQ